MFSRIWTDTLVIKKEKKKKNIYIFSGFNYALSWCLTCYFSVCLGVFPQCINHENTFKTFQEYKDYMGQFRQDGNSVHSLGIF